MKYSMIAVSILGLLYGIGIGATEEPAAAKTEAPQSTSVEINTDEEKVNYSLGYELGKDLKGQQLELLPEALLRGAEDAISGDKALVRPTQRAAALKQIKEKRAQANLEQAQAFLTANAEKEGVQTLPSGLQYRAIQPGEGNSPGADGSVVVNYRGTLIDGTQFDSSYDRGKPSTFQVKKVIKGWREALLLMKEGAKWERYIPPELAYGKRGLRKTIPPNNALVYEVELISVK
jgi:FKBP-type peptidyl-prolyl cis-trans isomerase FklB